jgi:hypothetical protein
MTRAGAMLAVCNCMRTAACLVGLLSLTLAAGCGLADSGDDSTADQNVQATKDGVPEPPEVLTGRYELSSFFDLTSAGLLPDAANETLKALSKFKENPSASIVELLTAANVPILGTVLKWLPGPLKDPFYNWFNEHVFKRVYAGLPVTEQIAGIIDSLGSIITRFEVVSALELGPADPSGNASANHRFAGVAFTVGDKRTYVDSPDLVSRIVAAENFKANVVHITESAPDVEDGRLDLGDHTFPLPLGQFAVLGADQFVKQKFGAADLRAGLGQIIDCAALAKFVAEKCVANLCVGHEDDVKSLCEAGLDAVVSETKSRIAPLAFSSVQFASGEAKMWDAYLPDGARDNKADRLDNGTWKTLLDPGNGKKRPVVATFVGKRIPD